MRINKLHASISLSLLYHNNTVITTINNFTSLSLGFFFARMQCIVKLWQCWRQEKNYAKVVNFLSLKSYLLSRIICFVSLFDFGSAREYMETSLKHSLIIESVRARGSLTLLLFTKLKFMSRTLCYENKTNCQHPRRNSRSLPLLLRRWASISEENNFSIESLEEIICI